MCALKFFPKRKGKVEKGQQALRLTTARLRFIWLHNIIGHDELQKHLQAPSLERRWFMAVFDLLWEQARFL